MANVTDEKAKLIFDLEAQGYDIRSICRKTGCRSSTVRQVLDAGMDVPKAKALRTAGWSIPMIEQEFGYKFTQDQIQTALLKAG